MRQADSISTPTPTDASRLLNIVDELSHLRCMARGLILMCESLGCRDPDLEAVHQHAADIEGRITQVDTIAQELHSTDALAHNGQGKIEAPPDATFRLIEHHRAALVPEAAAGDALNELERALPPDQRRSRFHASAEGWQITTHDGDDPRWVAAQQSLRNAMDARGRAAWALIEPGPSTTAGAVALAGYAAHVLECGLTWPDGSLPQGMPGPMRDRDWIAKLPGAVVRTIERTLVA